MGSSILSEVDNTSISGRVSQTRQRFPLSWLPVSRLLPPRSGLERSDFVLWHFSEVLRCPLYGRYRGKSGSETDIVKLSRRTHTGSRHLRHEAAGRVQFRPSTAARYRHHPADRMPRGSVSRFEAT